MEESEVLQQIEEKLALLTSIDSRLASIEAQLANPTGIQPLQELSINELAKDFTKRGPEALAEHNSRWKQRHKRK